MRKKPYHEISQDSCYLKGNAIFLESSIYNFSNFWNHIDQFEDMWY